MEACLSGSFQAHFHLHFSHFHLFSQHHWFSLQDICEQICFPISLTTKVPFTEFHIDYVKRHMYMSIRAV